MSDTYHQIFKKLPQAQPSASLVPKIMTRIVASQTRNLQIRAFIHGFLGVFALVTFWPALSYLTSASANSGLTSYLSLLISDSAYTLGHMRDWSMSVASSWPLMGTIIFLAITLVIANSIRILGRSWRSLTNSRRETFART
ncbi:MAG: hypothetical protein WCT02_01595 [Candidatus Paceibacterota bacterium]